MASNAGRQRAAARDLSDLGPHLAVEVEGTKYLLTARDMTALDVRAMRDQLGYGYSGMVARARADMDVDLLAAIVWMARRIKGERDLTYNEVAEDIHWTDEWSFIKAEAIADGDLTVGEHDPEG